MAVADALSQSQKMTNFVVADLLILDWGLPNVLSLGLPLDAEGEISVASASRGKRETMSRCRSHPAQVRRPVQAPLSS
jgi:hypothetical protein